MQLHRLGIWFSYLTIVLISIIFQLLTTDFQHNAAYTYFARAFLPLIFLLTMMFLIQRHRYWMFLPFILYYADRMAIFLQYNLQVFNNILNQDNLTVSDWFGVLNSTRILLFFLLLISYLFIIVHERYEALNHLNVYALILLFIHVFEVFFAHNLSGQNLIYIYLPASVSVSGDRKSVV